MIPRSSRVRTLLAWLVMPLVGACAEKLESSNNCPILCPGQEFEIRDTVLTADFVTDTTLGRYPSLGYENGLLLASRGDTADVRAVIRFDTLPRVWARSAADPVQKVAQIDSAYLILRLSRVGAKLPEFWFIDAYDVEDRTLPDTIPENLLPLFRADRLLGSLRLDNIDFVDTLPVRLPIDKAKLLLKVQDTLTGVRVGLRIRGGGGSASFRIQSTENGTGGPFLRFWVTPDTLVRPLEQRPVSATPEQPPGLAIDLQDYTVVAKAPALRRAGTFAVGGLPGTRGYLRFTLPSHIVDSSTVIRARLELTQAPVRDIDGRDSMTVRAQLGLAGTAITDLYRAATILSPAGLFVSDSIRVAPADSGVRTLELNALLRHWKNPVGNFRIPRVLVLRADLEGSSLLGLRFVGTTGAEPQRPRLRISYVPTATFGRP